MEIKSREDLIKVLEHVIAFGCSKELEDALIREFPELEESEDERIRKWLSDILDASNWRNDWPYTKQQVINYLEKQKDAFENGCQFGIMQEQARQEFEWSDEKLKEQNSPLTDEAFKEQLERVLRDNVLDTDIRITGDTVIGAKINPKDKGLFLRSLSDEVILEECKERGLDVKYSEEKNLAYRMNWVMQDYYKAGEDEEEREHRLKCYKLFWDALGDSEFFNRLESHKEELTKLQEKCKKFVEKQKEQKPVDEKAFEEWIDDWWKHNKVNNPNSYDKRDQIKFDERGFKNFCRGIRNMYVEQKPTEWDDLQAAFRNINEAFEDGKKEVVAHPEKYNLSKPAEWSEEDEKMLEVCSQYIGNTIPADYDEEEFTVKDCRNWLKSLPERFNLQPKQQWSEKDENCLKYAIDGLERYIKEHPDPEFGNATPCEKAAVRWLKSLRPSWKPSEAQINALHIAAASSKTDGTVLTGLLVQLKELM